MAFSVEVTGLEELYRKMEKLPDKATEIAARALYEGAGVVADAVSQAVQGIATEPFEYAKGGKKRKPSPEEKALLLRSSRGVSKFRKKLGVVDTSVGIKDGYANITWGHASSNIRTKYKVGYGGKARQAIVTEGKSSGRSAKPTYVIANAINSGTSFMDRQPFMRKAFSQSRNPAKSAIEATAMKLLRELEDG